MAVTAARVEVLDVIVNRVRHILPKSRMHLEFSDGSQNGHGSRNVGLGEKTHNG